MAITYNKHSIPKVFWRGFEILSIYTNGFLIWPEKSSEEEIKEILSCFFNGYWIDEYPWTDDTPWTD